MKTAQEIHLTCQIPKEMANQRLDQAPASLFPQYSRTRLKSWLESDKLKSIMNKTTKR